MLSGRGVSVGQCSVSVSVALPCARPCPFVYINHSLHKMPTLATSSNAPSSVLLLFSQSQNPNLPEVDFRGGGVDLFLKVPHLFFVTDNWGERERGEIETERESERKEGS